MSSHPLDLEKQHKLRLKGTDGGKRDTSLVLATVLERTDKGTATKLMKKRAKSFSKKELKKSLNKARSSISQLRDRTKEGLSSGKSVGSVVSESTVSLTTVGDASSSGATTSTVEEVRGPSPALGGAAPMFRLYVQFYECGNINGKGSKQLFDTYVKLRVGEQVSSTVKS